MEGSSSGSAQAHHAQAPPPPPPAKPASHDFSAFRSLCMSSEETAKGASFFQSRSGELFLAAALRSRDFVVNDAFKLVARFVDFRLKYGWGYRVNTDDDDGKMFEALASGVHWILPKPDAEGRSVVVLRPCKIQARGGKLDVNDYQKMAAIVMQQATGLFDKDASDSESWRDLFITLIVDLSEVGLSCVSQFGVSDVERGIKMWQNCFPVKLRKIYLVNSGIVVGGVVKLAKRFLEKKISDRITVLKTHGFRNHEGERKALHDALGGNAEFIPKLWGGTLDDDAWWKSWCVERSEAAKAARGAGGDNNDAEKYPWWMDFGY